MMQARARTLTGLSLAVPRRVCTCVQGLDPQVQTRRGTASDNPVSVRALACIIHGHVDHHLAILRERYGVAAAH